MAEYIEREEAINAVLSCFGVEDSIFSDATVMAIGFKLKAIPAADVQPVQWIPVTERLPEEKGNYLVVFDCGHGAEVHEAFFFKYFDSWEWYDPVEEYQKYNPSHWMPLPKPPKDGET